MLDRMVGLDNVKLQLRNIVNTYTYLAARKDIVQVRLRDRKSVV